MSREPAEPDWPPLTDAEVSAVLPGPGPAVVRWHSPRPWSAAGLVSWQDRTVFVKRHHVSVRTVGQLTAEHAFARHLRGRGQPVPAVLPLAGGRTAVRRGDFAYEAQELAAGRDLYRDVLSWSPYLSTGHAAAAGAALARLHLAAADYAAAERPPGVLIGSAAAVLSAAPARQLKRMVLASPATRRYLSGPSISQSWQRALDGSLRPAIERAADLCRPLPRQWGHGDWHPSNLGWTGAGSDAQVAAVFDLGLANRTCAVHDLGTAIERSCIGWLDLAESGHAPVDYPSLGALLDGYESVRPLRPAEAAALVAVLPVVHVEFALAELAYFAGVIRSTASADLAYDYLTGHCRWFAGPDGTELLGWLSARAGGRPG